LIRVAKYAAPNPLSILKTEIVEQELSIARRAVSPPKLAPYPILVAHQ
jgi:hypothetical protein